MAFAGGDWHASSSHPPCGRPRDVPLLYITDARRTKIKLAGRPTAAGISNCGTTWRRSSSACGLIVLVCIGIWMGANPRRSAWPCAIEESGGLVSFDSGPVDDPC